VKRLNAPSAVFVLSCSVMLASEVVCDSISVIRPDT